MRKGLGFWAKLMENEMDRKWNSKWKLEIWCLRFRVKWKMKVYRDRERGEGSSDSNPMQNCTYNQMESPMSAII